MLFRSSLAALVALASLFSWAEVVAVMPNKIAVENNNFFIMNYFFYLIKYCCFLNMLLTHLQFKVYFLIVSKNIREDVTVLFVKVDRVGFFRPVPR